MRYAVTFVFTMLLGFAHAAPADAQPQRVSAVQDFLNRIADEGGRHNGVLAMVLSADRTASNRDDERRRGPTATDENGETRSDTGGRDRTERGDRRERNDRADRPARDRTAGSDRAARTERTDRDSRDHTDRTARDRTDRAERADRDERPARTEQPTRTERTTRRDAPSRPGDLGRRAGDGGYGNSTGAKRGGGPKFCRNGQGHPVHGRRWCIDKGFGLGNDRGVFDTRRERRDERRYPSRDDRTILDDILGRLTND